MSDQVRTPEDRFSRIMAHIVRMSLHWSFFKLTCKKYIHKLPDEFEMARSPRRHLSPIRMRQKYTRVNILRCANFTRGKQMAHANANTHQSIFTYG